MKKAFGKFTAVAVFLLFAVTAAFAGGRSDKNLPMSGKVVILHSNDVHGNIEGYARMAQLKNDFEADGAEVIVVDAGDYMQGTTYVSTQKGVDAIDMMNAAGYALSALGNHEFDYGYALMSEGMKKAKFTVLCANIFDEKGKTIFPATTIIKRKRLSVGFLGLSTPQTQTSANPAFISSLSFPEAQEFYAVAQSNIDALKSKGADIVVALAHLGVDDSSSPHMSTELYANTSGIDFIIDGHSHTVMTEGENGEPIQSTGTQFAYIGVVVLDAASKTIEDHYLLPVSHTEEDGTVVYDIEADPKVYELAQSIIDRVNREYDIVFAETLVDLNGDRAPGNRTEETNLGSLVADAMRWSIVSVEGSLEVPEEFVIGMSNGGSIRAPIPAGNITKKDINTVLPFGNTLVVVYVSGAELLEALEASTYCTPEPAGGFPQVSGMEFSLDTTRAYDPNPETYPASTYYGPASINRVTIDNINGRPFDPDATYAVVTSDFIAAGGDTYYAFAAAERRIDTGMMDVDCVISYITDYLGGVIGEEYAEPFGRIHIR